MTGSDAVRKAPPLGEVRARDPGDGPALRARADATLLVVRVGREVVELAMMADDIQGTIGAHVGAAAMEDPALMRQAQMIDLLTQSLNDLSSFLARMERHDIGHEALDFEEAASSSKIGRLGDRLAGRNAAVPTDDIEFF